jgi:hypothetical protein
MTHFLSRLTHLNLFCTPHNHCRMPFVFLLCWVHSNLPSHSLIPTTFHFLAFYPFSHVPILSWDFWVSQSLPRPPQSLSSLLFSRVFNTKTLQLKLIQHNQRLSSAHQSLVLNFTSLCLSFSCFLVLTPLLKSWPPKLSPFSWLNPPLCPDPLVNTCCSHSDPSHISNNLLDQHHLSCANAEYPWFTLRLLAHLKPLDYLSLKSLLCLHL